MKTQQPRQVNQEKQYVNVTNLNPNKRRSIFIESFNKRGFTAFTKRTQDNQTYYVFTYKILQNQDKGDCFK